MSDTRGFKSCSGCGKQKLIEDGRSMCDGCLNDRLTLEMMQVDTALREIGWAGPSPIPLAPGVQPTDEDRSRFILRIGNGNVVKPAARTFRLDVPFDFDKPGEG